MQKFSTHKNLDHLSNPTKVDQQETAVKENKLKIYTYSNEITAYKGNTPSEIYYDVIKGIETIYKPDAIFITGEEKLGKIKRKTNVLTLDLGGEDETRTKVTKDVLKDYEERQQKKGPYNVNIICTFYYIKHKYDYNIPLATIYQNKLEDIRIEITDKRKSILTPSSYNLRYLGSIFNITSIPHLSTPQNIIEEQTISPTHRLIVTEEKIKNTQNCHKKQTI